MRERHAGRSRRRDSRCDAADHVATDAGARDGFLFLTAATMAGSQSGGLPIVNGTQWFAFGALVALNSVLTLLFSHLGAQEADVRAGDTVSPFYDPMIAKLIVHGATRAEALARLDEALAQTHIVGLATNVQFLRHVVTSRSFAEADLDTALIPREAGVLFQQEKVGLPMAVAAAVANALLAEKAGEGADPFSRRDGWSSHGEARRRFGRLDSSRSDEGAGLGIALAESIAHLHQGQLVLEDNKPGLLTGLELPLHHQDAPRPA